MEIFIRIEISARELDGKILLALVASGEGHRVLACDFPTLMRRVARRTDRQRFVHMKDLAPTRATLHIHRILKAAGCYISSQDEDPATMNSSLARRSNLKSRFGLATVSSADAIFCWGDQDREALMRLFPAEKEKFHKTGSPRVDMWGPKFSSVYLTRKICSGNPFVVVCSTVGHPLGWKLAHQLVAEGRLGLPPSSIDSRTERQLVAGYRDTLSLLLDYLDLIRFLSVRKRGYQILVKPHPSENPKGWETLLSGLDGVGITSAPTSELIRQSHAVITSVSTTAIEAAFVGAPLITYAPTPSPNLAAGMVQSLGKGLAEKEEVASQLDFYAKNKNVQKEGSIKLPREVKRRFFASNSALAASRIVRVWEEAISRSQCVGRPRLNFMDLRYWVSSAFPGIARALRLIVGIAPEANMVKYPPLDRVRVSERIEEIRRVLGLEDSVQYKFIGKRSILFEPVSDAP